MQITVASTKVGKTGTNDKGTWELIIVTSDDGSDFTTFHTGVKNLASGTVIDIGEPKIEKGKLSFKDYKIISEPAGPPASAKTEDQAGMTPELWAEKDRMERWSRESNACFMGLPELIKCQPAEGKPKEAYDLALDYAMAHFSLPKPAAKPPARTAAPATEPEPESDEDWDAVGTTFANQGEFYSACLKRWKLQKSQVDAEISGMDLSLAEGRGAAWRVLVEVMKKPPEEE